MTNRDANMTRRFGSRIGLGLAALGRPGYINLGHADDLGAAYEMAAMQRHAHAVLDAAWANGIRYFDVARSYGRAEAFLSSWLRARAIAPEQVSVGSKWGYTYTANWQVQADVHEVKAHTLARFTAQWEESTAQLGDYLQLYQVHSATLESGILTNQQVLAALAQLRAEQGIAVGLSLSGTAQAATLRKALEIEFDGVRLFEVVQATWNLLERSAGEALAEAKTAGMNVIIKEAVANGRLTARNGQPTFAEQRALLQREAARLHTTIDGLALAVVLHQPWVDVVLSGAATVQQVQANAAATQVVVDDEALEQLNSVIEDPDQYWSTRSGLPWN